MKKMRMILMSAVSCMMLLSTVALTSCNKEDVAYNENEEEVLCQEVDGKDFSVPCPLCGVDVAPLTYHLHQYAPEECPLGEDCTHYTRNHWHYFINGTTNRTWLELTTHFGGTILDDPHFFD